MSFRISLAILPMMSSAATHNLTAVTGAASASHDLRRSLQTSLSPGLNSPTKAPEIDCPHLAWPFVNLRQVWDVTGQSAPDPRLVALNTVKSLPVQISKAREVVKLVQPSEHPISQIMHCICISGTCAQSDYSLEAMRKAYA